MKYAIAIVALALVGCSNEPHPVHADNGVWIRCASGGFCERSRTVCGQVNHACGPNDCCEFEDDGRVFRLKKRPQSTEAK